MSGWVCGAWSGLVSEVDGIKYVWVGLWGMECVSERGGRSEVWVGGC